MPPRPTLRFAPDAWAKLLFLRDVGATEIGGFGISAPGDPLLVAEIRLVRQRCDWASVAFADDAVAELFDELVDQGRRPEEFGRIWIHTHPGSSPRPSTTDEETFARVFGSCDWAVMAILARGGASYARLQTARPVTVAAELAVAVDFNVPFAASDADAWRAEYAACVSTPPRGADRGADPFLDDPWLPFDDFIWNLSPQETTDVVGRP